MRMFNLPINDDRIQTLTEEQIDFMIWSDLLDNPESLKRASQQFYDPEFDEFDSEGEDEEESTENDNNFGDYDEGDTSFNDPIENENSMPNNWDIGGSTNQEDIKLKDFDDDWEEV